METYLHIPLDEGRRESWSVGRRMRICSVIGVEEGTF